MLFELGEFLNEFKDWIESESDLHYGQFYSDPYDLREATEGTKRRIIDYWHKVQTERYSFEPVRDSRMIILRSRIGRTEKANVTLINLFNLYMAPTTDNESLHQFLYRKQLCHIIEKADRYSDGRLLSS